MGLKDSKTFKLTIMRKTRCEVFKYLLQIMNEFSVYYNGFKT